MVSLRNLAFVASVVVGIASGYPTTNTARESWVSGTQNNTQEFYILMTVTYGPINYNGWTSKH